MQENYHSSPFRSPVPDLIFEDEQDARIADIQEILDNPEAVCAAIPLHRVTVFLTYRCNLACPYCKTIVRSSEELAARPQKAATFTLDAFQALLDAHHDTPIRHLHFTGGEATLLRDLPAMVRAAKAAGVERLSVTSNGTLPPEVYLNLAACGLDEIRISLDAADPGLGTELTQRSGAWQRAVETIRTLAAERRRGCAYFLIINTVVGLANRQHLARIIRFMLDLGPDDIKLITSVDEKDDLAAFEGRSAVAREITALLAQYPEHAFPLLRRKLRTVFAHDSIGLSALSPAPDGKWHCYIPLTERTVDGVYYYPCSVYLREGGAPLGRIDEAQEIQRAKTAAFVTRGDCLDDPICKRYCLNCTKAFNVKANEARACCHQT